MKTIYLCRHGQTQWNTLGKYQGIGNSPLTEIGKDQARRVGQFLQDKNISKIFCSPLGRAQETAAIVNEYLQTEIITVSKFYEMDFGELQAQKKESVQDQYPEFFNNRENDKLYTPYPSGESYQDVYDRVKPALIPILKENENLAIIGHGAMNRMLRTILLDINLEDAVYHSQKNNEIIECRLLEKNAVSHFV